MSTSSDRPRLTSYDTRFGSGLLAWRDGLLIELRLPGTHTGSRKHSLSGCSPSTPAERRLTRKLQAYFRGESMAFPMEEVPLDRSGWTSFQAAVATTLARVSRGETITYSELAAAAGHPRAQRAVGNLLAANPYPVIIPCHRVVRSDGSLGGFSGGEGWKARLLKIEGLPFPGPG